MTNRNAKKDITEKKFWKIFEWYSVIHYAVAPIGGCIIICVADNPSKHPVIFYAGLAVALSWLVVGFAYATILIGTERRKLAQKLYEASAAIKSLKRERRQLLRRINSKSEGVTAYRTKAIASPKPEGLEIDTVTESQIHEVERLAELDDEISEVKRILH